MNCCSMSPLACGIDGIDISSSRVAGCEVQEVGLKTLGWIDVLLTGPGFEVRLIECSEPFKILSPDGNVFDVHGLSR